MTTQFDNVTVLTKGNVYFDGKCVSHTVIFADGSKKTLGVILPSSLSFHTDAPEIMEINGGSCKVRLHGASNWQAYSAGTSFNVPGNAGFDIEVTHMLDYICHFG